MTAVHPAAGAGRAYSAAGGGGLGTELSGLDLAMLGDDAWDETFMSLKFEFERPVPALERALRS